MDLSFSSNEPRPFIYIGGALAALLAHVIAFALVLN